MSCEKCCYWDGEKCTDPEEFINKEDNCLCCRYHPNAMHIEEVMG